MIGINLQQIFEDKIGGLMTNTVKSLTSLEEERFLNNAQDLYLDNLADVFEFNEKARKALSKLTKGVSSSPITPTGLIPLSQYSIFFDPYTGITNSLSRIVEEQAISSGERIKIQPITHDQYLANIKNPFKMPYGELVWRVDVDSLIELIPDAVTTIDTYEFRYIENPVKIEFASQEELSFLDDDLYKIADIAVNLAINALSIGRSKE